MFCLKSKKLYQGEKQTKNIPSLLNLGYEDENRCSKQKEREFLCP